MIFNNKFLIAFIFFTTCIFGATHNLYTGSLLVYFIFTLVFFCLISLNCLANFSYTYFFLSILLWLGFYLKLASHLLHSFPYLDPIGGFISTSSAWDEVLMLAIVSALGLIAARALYIYPIKKITCRLGTFCYVPIAFIKFRKYLLFLLILLILFIGLINSYFGIHQIGTAPRTIFAYPANAFIAYMLNFGLITVASIYLWWDICSAKKIIFAIAIVLLEGLCVSMSIVSRGIFIFHLLPILLVLYRIRLYKLNLKSIATLFLSASIFFATSYFVVDAARGYLYRAQDVDFRVQSKNLINQLNLKIQERDSLQNIASISAENLIESRRRELDEEIMSLRVEVDKNQSEVTSSSTTLTGKFWLITSELRDQLPAALNRAVMLLTNRWVGLEGAMSIQAIPNKSFNLFVHGLMEGYQPGTVPLYQHLSKSIYIGMDPDQWKFGSLPGCTAFLFYSGSFLFVFLGMFALTSLAICFEFLILFLTGNLFLVSLYSCFIANIIAQLGDVPKQNVITIIMLITSAVIIGLFQRFLAYRNL